MERLIRAHETAGHALSTLTDILKEPAGMIVRDASIQRFEYTFEAVWKLLKLHLFVHHGIDAGSSKACFREAFKVGMMTEEQTELAMMMTDDRNLTSHTYIEAIADLVYSRISGYAELMSKLVAACI
jgi:nucleotidyltransferase substrate binding protein (TIGR01987 family)